MVEDEDDGPCTNCWESGYDGNREARCHCLPPLPKAPMVEVTQADREAAASWMRKAKADGMIRRGHDNDLPTVQAFATHRTEAVAALEARVRELEGVLQPFASEADARRNNLNGAVCFPQSFLIAARKALHDPRKG